MNKTQLSAQLVEKLSAQYDSSEMSETERTLLSVTSPNIAGRGFLLYEEFLKICEWKSVRTKPLVRLNSEAAVLELSKIAFSCSEPLRIQILTILKGVSVPTASAILTIWRPDQFTVYDFRVLSALNKLKHPILDKEAVSGAQDSYYQYLDTAKLLAHDLNVSLRNLDKCLWMFDKYYES